MRRTNHEMTDDPIVIRILELLRKQKKTGKDLEMAIGLANGAVSKWKYLGLKSYRNHLREISEYLNVPIELLESADSEQKESESEKRIIEMYRSIGSDEKKYIEQTLRYLVQITKCKNDELYSKKYNKIENETRKPGGETSNEDENPLS